MKKIRSNNKILKAVLCVSALCAFAIPASITPVNAALPGNITPSDIQQGALDAGQSYTHDLNNLRYERTKRGINDDYKYYRERREIERDPNAGNQFIKNEIPVSDVKQAQIEEIDTKGVFVNSIEVSPSEILTQEEIANITRPLVGKNVFISDIQKAIDEINNIYAEKGYVTARAFLPEQTVQNGNIFIELIESKIGNITVENNKWTKDKYITDRMPQKQYQLFDIVDLEKEILDFNRYNEGVNLTANLKAGAEAGTTDIEFSTKEKIPFHIRGMMDNQGRKSIGPIRGGAMVTADSLFGYRDKMSVGTYFSKYSVSPFFDYSVPVNKHDGRVGFSFFSGFAKVGSGPNSWMDIKSRTYNYALYYSHPLIRKPGLELKSYSSVNYKRANVSTGVQELEGYLNRLDEVTSVETSLQLRKDTKYGIWYLNQGISYAAPLFDDKSNYLKINGNAVRLHDFSHGVIGILRGNYQVIPGRANDSVPYLDQFQTGGMMTVRGYSEGIMIGKNGYYLSGELEFPLMPRQITSPRSGEKIPFIGKYVKGAIFADHSGVFPSARTGEDIYGGSYFLASIGMGLKVALPGDLSARLYWGYPLINNAYEQDRKYGRFHFELALEPDFDSLLRNRSTKAQPAAQKDVQADFINNYDDVRHYDYFEDGFGAL